MPVGNLSLGELEPSVVRPVVVELVVDRVQGNERVADDGDGPLFVGIPASGVDGDERDSRLFEHRPRAGGEVLEPRADRNDDVCAFGHGVRRRRTRDSDGSGVVGMGAHQRRLSRHRLDDRDVPPFREIRQFLDGAGVVHPAPGNDHRPLGPGQCRRGAPDIARIGPGPADVVSLWSEEVDGVVIGLRLNVLRQREEGRPACRRVEHDRKRLGQRLDDLLRPGDAIPVPRYRSERVGHRHRGVVEDLHLLEDGIDDAMLEGVAGEEEKGDSVGVGNRGGGDHVGAAGADGGRCDHDPAAPHRLGIGHGGESHRLLVVSPPRRERVLDRFEGFGERCHVAVTEDAEDARKHGHFLTVDDGELGGEPLDDGLARRESNGVHRISSSPR